MNTAHPPKPFRENYGTATRPAEFHQPAEEHLRKLLADTLADLDVAINLCGPEDVLQRETLERAFNRIAGAKRRQA